MLVKWYVGSWKKERTPRKFLWKTVSATSAVFPWLGMLLRRRKLLTSAASLLKMESVSHGSLCLPPNESSKAPPPHIPNLGIFFSTQPCKDVGDGIFQNLDRGVRGETKKIGLKRLFFLSFELLVFLGKIVNVRVWFWWKANIWDFFVCIR